MTATVALATTGLTKTYGQLFAVRDLDLSVPKGSVFALVGPNGAGKTTTFAMMAGLLKPSRGTVTLSEFDVAKKPREVRRRLGYMPDTLGVYDTLRVDEYLQFFSAAYEIPSHERDPLIDSLLELVDLRVKRDSMVDSLSRGMKQRLSLARALVHDPEVLILDEPTAGLDPNQIREVRRMIRELGAKKTILLSTHILQEVEALADRVILISEGRLRFDGKPSELRRDGLSLDERFHQLTRS